MNPFQLPHWLKNPHLQTVGSVLVPRAMRFFRAQDRLFQLSDGSRLTAECSWQNHRTVAPTVIIVPGLNGSTVSSYVRGTAAKAYAQGFNVVRLNLRNGGNSERLSQTLTHAGQSDDLRTVITELINRDGLSKIGLIGFSFGGGICLKLVGEWGPQTPKEVIGAVGISPLLDLAACVQSVDHRAPPIYRWQLLRGLKSSLRRRNRLFPGCYQLAALGQVRTLRQYDDAVAPLNGFKNADDYYRQASAAPHLSRAATPLLIIQADDDAVIPIESLPVSDNPLVTYLVTHGGGHGGFITSSKGRDPDLHWGENRAIEFLLTQSRPA